MRTTVLRRQLRGRVVEPHQPGYERARQIWNGAIDKRPAVIAYCLDTADVATALRFGREHDLPIAVRAGGHGVAGKCLPADGLVIDVRGLAELAIDPATQIARAGAGLLNGELDAAAGRLGLATTAGIVSHTGLAGLALGGGIGWLARRFGATCDNLTGAAVVTADGVVREAAADADLRWALTGAGANFGIVTRLDLAVHEIGQRVLAGVLTFGAESAGDVLAGYAELAAVAPPELGTIVSLRHAPPAAWLPPELHGRPVVLIGVCWTGATQERLDQLLAPLRARRPLADSIALVRYADHQQIFDGGVPHGLRYHWRSGYVADLADQTISRLTSDAWSMRNRRSYTIMFQLGGALARPDPDATAFGGRHGFAVNINAVWDSTESDDVAWVNASWEALRPSSAGVYVNFLDDEPADRVRAAYSPAAYRRLVQVKRRYDPDNVFRANHNIDPAVSPAQLVP
ncbi:MAG TPA: FAD-binding oxidoreductase [Streptosporangiaceae bacterium]|nr:FAD-binding oxidoreductase [Streptosporangiaceae bacterium]